MPCHKFPKIACASKTAHSFYDWLLHYLQTKDYVQCPSDMSRHIASFVATFKDGRANLSIPSLSNDFKNETVACSCQLSSCQDKWMEQLEPTPNICTYWPNNPSFNLKSVLLRRLIFINEGRTKYVSVGFYPARDYLSLVGFGVPRRAGSPKSLILSDEQVAALSETLPTLRGDMCSAGAGGCRCESGPFRLDVTRSGRTARLYVDSQFIHLTLQDIEYLSRMFNIVQQQLRDYIVALQDVLPFVSNTLTSVTYVDPSTDASKIVDFPNLYEELVSFV